MRHLFIYLLNLRNRVKIKSLTLGVLEASKRLSLLADSWLFAKAASFKKTNTVLYKLLALILCTKQGQKYKDYTIMFKTFDAESLI